MKTEQAMMEKTGLLYTGLRRDDSSTLPSDQQSLGRLLMTVEQTAKLLCISPVTIYCKIGRRAKKKFEIKPIRIGGSIRFDVRDIEAFLDAQKRRRE